MSSSLTYNRAFRVANLQPQLLLIISAREQRPFAASLNSVGIWRSPVALPESRFRCTVEVAIHTILYVRQVYPADLFVRRKKYETPVYQSRHPGLNEYIAGAVKAISDELALVSMSAPFAPNAPKLGFHLGVRRKGRASYQRQRRSCTRAVHFLNPEHDSRRVIQQGYKVKLALFFHSRALVK
jgi:hypothetical protein